MKKLLQVFGFLASALVAMGTEDTYINNAPIYGCCGLYGGVAWYGCTNPPPTIDAYNFINRSTFNVSMSGCGFTESPYEMLNLINFTNTGSGNMYGLPGFRFDYFHGNSREPMNAWVNQGTVEGNTWIVVAAQTISSSGPLVTGPSGLIRLGADTITLKRDGLRSGQSINTYYGGGYTIGSNYYNAPGISDVYWGAGTNNHMDGRGQLMSLTTPYWDIPCSQSPDHQVMYPGMGTNALLVNVPSYQYCFPPMMYYRPYNAHVWTNQVGNTKYIQIVYVPTNNVDPTFTTDVKFYPYGLNGGADVVVAFQMLDYDIVNMSYSTNGLYLVDHSAFVTNISLARPSPGGGGTGRRPNIYELFRSAPYEYLSGNNANAPFSNTLIYKPGYLSNQVNMIYGAYAANLAGGNFDPYGGGVVVGEPTNMPGRIEITGNVLDLEQTRIRSENTILVRAHENLVNNKLARVDAPYLSYDLRSQQSPLYITNLAPAYVQRLYGDIYCWTGVWDNYETNEFGGTNTIKFQVLIVDSALQSTRPVSVYEFMVHATNVVLSDSMNIGRTVLLDAKQLLVSSDLIFPPNSGWAATNVPQLVHFTNNGNINIPQNATYGPDRSYGYKNFINNGTNTASAQFIQTSNFVNRGSLIASGGLLSLDAKSVNLLGAPTIVFTNIYTNSYFDFFTGDYITNISTNIFTNSIGAKLLANSDIEIHARDMTVSNSVIMAGNTSLGALILAVTNSLFDTGPDINEWVTTAGFQMLLRPANSDLIHTHLTSKAPRFMEVYHIWNAQNRGATDAAGFSNNVALGKLTLDGDLETLFHFSAPSGSANKAMYVDYLDLQNNALVNYRTALVIEPNLTIYIADANISPRKLEQVYPDRIKWVPYFAGPFSSTNMVYPSGRTYTFNESLVTDKELDSDQDGIPNCYDSTPIYVNESIGLSIVLKPASPLKAVFSWDSLANSVNYLEQQSPPATNWTPVAQVPGGSARTRISITNSVPNDSLRFYRVRVEPPPLF